MKIILLVLTILPALLFNSCATSGLATLAPEDERYYKITFLAYGSGTLVEGKKSIAGHASVSIERNGIWGFYPSTPGKLITKKGRLSYETEYPRTQEYVDFFVDEQTMNNIWLLIHQWENNPPYFAIPVNDCVGFIYRVCNTMGLRYNPFALLPTSAIRDIRNLNSRRATYRESATLAYVTASP
ncbi:MAG: hypothetical protein LBH18_01825 [Spirochaetaceae bacterium]|jgi:hypothetical protein|nr:hypothetical protein [Spirochaetaceae bacterium]